MTKGKNKGPEARRLGEDREEDPGRENPSDF